MGSGTTGIACFNVDRNFVGIERDEEYYKVCVERLEEAKKTKKEIERKSSGLWRFVK